MQTISTDAQTFVDYLQTLCLYKGSVRANCVAMPCDALLQQFCIAGSSTVYFYIYNQNGEEKQIGWLWVHPSR